MSQQANQLNLLREAIKAIPAVKYALGVAGIGAAVALVAGFRVDYRVAVFGTIIMFVLMFVLVIFSWFSRHAGHGVRYLAFTLAWLFVILIGITSILLTSSFFFQWPRPLENYILKDSTVPTTSPSPLSSSTPPRSSPSPTLTPISEQPEIMQITPSGHPSLPRKMSRDQVTQHINRARSLYNKGGDENYQAAIHECDKTLRLDPGNQDAIKLKAQIQRTIDILNQ